MTDLAHLHAVASAATQQTWSIDRDGQRDQLIAEVGDARVALIDVAADQPHLPLPTVDQVEADALHVATFDPPTVLQLLDELRALRAATAAQRQVLDHLIPTAARALTTAGQDPARLLDDIDDDTLRTLVASLIPHPELAMS